jgi:hypothetical protein
VVQINADDLEPNIRQKGVDMRIGLDIASLTLKKHAQMIVLVTADSDFVPAMKFARRERAQLVLITLGRGIREGLKEHADIVIEQLPFDAPKAAALQFPPVVQATVGPRKGLNPPASIHCSDLLSARHADIGRYGRKVSWLKHSPHVPIWTGFEKLRRITFVSCARRIRRASLRMLSLQSRDSMGSPVGALSRLTSISGVPRQRR